MGGAIVPPTGSLRWLCAAMNYPPTIISIAFCLWLRSSGVFVPEAFNNWCVLHPRTMYLDCVCVLQRTKLNLKETLKMRGVLEFSWMLFFWHCSTKMPQWIILWYTGWSAPCLSLHSSILSLELGDFSLFRDYWQCILVASSPYPFLGSLEEQYWHAMKTKLTEEITVTPACLGLTWKAGFHAIWWVCLPRSLVHKVNFILGSVKRQI